MIIFVRLDKTYVIDISSKISANELYDVISNKINIPKNIFFLTYCGKYIQLNNEQINNLLPNHTINVSIKMYEGTIYSQQCNMPPNH